MNPIKLSRFSTDFVTSVLCSLRGLYFENSKKHWIVRLRHSSPEVERFIDSEQCAKLCLVGPITPDHVIRTKGWPLLIQWESFVGSADEKKSGGLRRFLSKELDRYARDYASYFQRNNVRFNGGKIELDRLPRVLLIQGVGLVTVGLTLKAVDISADIYEHTVPTILHTAKIGDYSPVSRSHLFDCEYWELEQRKLRLKKAPSGRTVLL